MKKILHQERNGCYPLTINLQQIAFKHTHCVEVRQECSDKLAAMSLFLNHESLLSGNFLNLVKVLCIAYLSILPLCVERLYLALP